MSKPPTIRATILSFLRVRCYGGNEGVTEKMAITRRVCAKMKCSPASVENALVLLHAEGKIISRKRGTWQLSPGYVAELASQ